MRHEITPTEIVTMAKSHVLTMDLTEAKLALALHLQGDRKISSSVNPGDIGISVVPRTDRTDIVLTWITR